MNWVRKGCRHVCRPYQIMFCTRGWGFEVWARGKCIKRGIPYLDTAKAYCEKHRAEQEVTA